MKDIVKECGVSLGTIYRNFGSKEGLLAIAYLQFRAEQNKKFTVSKITGDTSHARIMNAFRAISKLSEGRPNIYAISDMMHDSKDPEVIMLRRKTEIMGRSLLKSLLDEKYSEHADLIVTIIERTFYTDIRRWRSGDIEFTEVFENLDEVVQYLLDK